MVRFTVLLKVTTCKLKIKIFFSMKDETGPELHRRDPDKGDFDAGQSSDGYWVP